VGSAQGVRELLDVIVALVRIVRVRLVRQNEIEARVQRRKAFVQRCKECILQLPNQGLDMGNKALTALANAFTEGFAIQLKSLPKLSKLSAQNVDLLAQGDTLAAD
jgi:hypothetical protein